MKKMFLSLTALLMCLSASAFEFDGIDLNGSFVEITRQISQKGYVYDDTKNCLKGVCQGDEIYLSINNTDVKEKGKIGQLIIDVPMNVNNAYTAVSKTFNVVYHQIAKDDKSTTYKVAEDGTTLVVTATGQGVRLTYNTPYYKVK
ncbi:MAG: hypothetical protein MSA31_06355 [Bacteroidales bacterium]|nr:hypothetical protein [Bacteroidales bacterium]MDD6493989.1 hypothetical protein [Bacteroidales bacterium]MDY4926601.1 hypothetical protein [Prevotella sp.]MDY5033104.1 hypothetical protein [Prevotella sp.]